MLKGPRLNLSGLSWLDHVLSMGSYLTLIQIAYLGSLTPSPTPTHTLLSLLSYSIMSDSLQTPEL